MADLHVLNGDAAAAGRERDGMLRPAPHGPRTHVRQRLAAARKPGAPALTLAGRAWAALCARVLAAEEDAVTALGGLDRWVGGTHLAGRDP